MKKNNLILAIPLLLLCGCADFDEAARPETMAADTGEGTVTVGLSFGTEDPVTRSSMIADGQDADKISNVTVAVYDERLLGTWYFEGDSPQVLSIPKSTEAFYVVANMGDQSVSFPEWESAVPGFSYRIQDFGDIAKDGMPMCAKVVWDKTVEVMVPLERLFAKIKVTLEKDSSFINTQNGSNSLLLNDIYVRNANTLLCPFGQSMAMADSDAAEQSDFQGSFGTLMEQAGQDSFTAEFYVPENMMGTLLPANADPWNKTADNLVFGENDLSGRCTYIEIGAVATYPLKGWSGRVKYRFFLGKDNVSNFDVCRNSVYDITVIPDYGNLLKASWKVDFSGNDLRRLEFTDARTEVDGIPVYYFLKGTKNRIYMFYHRTAGSVASSQTMFRGVDWDYNGDIEGLKDAGVASSITYGTGVSPSTIAYERDVVEFDVPLTAKIGTYSVSASTHDALKTARADIIVVDSVEWPMEFSWDIIPSYVSQYGILDISDVPEDVLPVRYAKKEVPDHADETGEIVRLVPLNDDCTRFKVIGCRQGKSVVTFTNKDGDQASEIELNVRRPSLCMQASSSAYILDIIGTEKAVTYSITDDYGNALANVDEDAAADFLEPVPVLGEIPSAYFGVDVSPRGRSLDVYVRHLDEAMYGLRNVAFPIRFGFRDCKGELFPGFDVMFTLPVDEDTGTCHGKVNDYSLLTYRPLRRQYCAENGISYPGTDTYSVEPEKYEFDSKKIYIGTKVASSLLPVSSVTLDGITRQSYPGASRNSGVSYAFSGSWMRYELVDGMSSLKIWPVIYYGIYDQKYGQYYYDVDFGASESAFTRYSHEAGRKYVRFNYVNRHSGETLGIRQGYVEFYVYAQLVWRLTEGAFEFGDADVSSKYGYGYVINGNVQQSYPFTFNPAGGDAVPGPENVPCGLYPLFAYGECIGTARDLCADGLYHSLPVMDRRIRSRDSFLTDLGIGDYYVRFNRWVYYDISLSFAVQYRTTDKFREMMSGNEQTGTDCTGMFDAVYSDLWTGTPSGAFDAGADPGCVRSSDGTVGFAASDDNEKIVISNVLKNRYGNVMRLDGGCEVFDPAVATHSRRGIGNMLYRVIGFPGLDYRYMFSQEKKSHPAAPWVYELMLPRLFSHDGPRIIGRLNRSGTGRYAERDIEGNSYYQFVAVQDR